MISLDFSLRDTALKLACIIIKFHPDIKSADIEKLAPLNFLVEEGESSSLLYQNCSS